MNDPLADAVRLSESDYAALISSLSAAINEMADLLPQRERDEIKASLAAALQENTGNPAKTLQALNDHLNRARDLLIKGARQ